MTTFKQWQKTEIHNVNEFHISETGIKIHQKRTESVVEHKIDNQSRQNSNTCNYLFLCTLQNIHKSQLE